MESLAHYAVTEIVNNAIDYSAGESVEVATSPPLRFRIEDDGVGIFDHLRRRLALPDRLAALQELSKGKVTTQPDRHKGEGIFFVSKAVDFFEIESGGLVWKVDNVRDDTAVGVAPPFRGTRVRFEIDPETERKLHDVFDEYTTDYELSKTRIRVKLVAIGVRFVSRSEARRLMQGLERFGHVVLDFAGVAEAGHGFADEVFRVWRKAHPAVEVEPANMNPAVAFLIERTRRASSS